jgi:hypothetical protein
MNETGVLCDDCLKKVFLVVRDALAEEQETAAKFLEAQMKKAYQELLDGRRVAADYVGRALKKRKDDLSAADKATIQAHRATAREFREASDWEILRSLAELNSLSAEHAARKISAAILSAIGKAVPELAETLETSMGSSVGGRILDI